MSQDVRKSSRDTPPVTERPHERAHRFEPRTHHARYHPQQRPPHSHQPRYTQRDDRRSNQRPYGHSHRGGMHGARQWSEAAESSHAVVPSCPAPAPTSHEDTSDAVLQADEQLVLQLGELGFSPVDAHDALLIHHNDADAAASWLFAQQQARLEPAKPRQQRVAISAATPVLKFKIGTSVSVDVPAPARMRQASATSAPPTRSWLESIRAEQQQQQQANAKPAVAAVAPAPAVTAVTEQALPAGFVTVAQRVQQQEAKDQRAATQRTKAYLQLEQTSRATSDTGTGVGDFSSPPSASARADLALFAQSKRELLANLFDYDAPAEADCTSASPWLQLVATQPDRALQIVHDSSLRAANPEYSDAALTAVDSRGLNAVHLCCQYGHAKLLQALLALPRSSLPHTDDAHPPLAPPSESRVSPSASSDDSESGSSSSDTSEDSSPPPAGTTSHVRYLFDPQALTHTRSSAVHLCCRYGSHACLEALLSRPLLLDVKDVRGNRPLHIAAAHGDVESVEMLLAMRGRRTSHPHVKNKLGQTPMHVACQFGHLRVAQLLHKHDRTLVHAKDRKQNLPLHLAVGYGDVVHFLVRHDTSNATCAQRSDDTAAALSLGGTVTAPLSTAAEPMVNSCNAAQQCALSLSLALPRSLCDDSLRLLLELDASTDPHRLGSTGTHTGEVLRAAAYDASKVVNCRLRSRHTLLRKRAATMHGSNKLASLTTPLHEAASRGLESAVALLLQYGAPIDAPSHPHRSTPLHYACRGGHGSIVGALLRQGADRSRLNALGGSCLMFAARGGHAEVVQQLLTPALGVSSAVIESLKQHVDPRGETALSLALSLGHSSTVRLLVRADAALVNARAIDAVQARIDQATRELGLSAVRRILRPLLCATDPLATPPPFSDVALQCADGVLPAHACVLSARSEFFRGIIEQRMRQQGRALGYGRSESPPPLELSFTHISVAAMHLVLTYVYRGCIPRQLPVDRLVQLMLLANELLLPHLLTLCMQVAACSGYLNAEARVRMHPDQAVGSSSSLQSMVATLAQLQSMLAPHAFESMYAHAMQQAAQAAHAAEAGVAEVVAAVASSSPPPSAAISAIPAPAASATPAAGDNDDDEDDDLFAARAWRDETVHRSDEADAFVSERAQQLDDDMWAQVGHNDVQLVGRAPPTSGGRDGSHDVETLDIEGLDAEECVSHNVAAAPREYVHRCILACSSSVLTRLCEQGAQRGPSGALVLHLDLDEYELHFLRACLYRPALCFRHLGPADPPADRIEALMRMAHSFLDPGSEALALVQQALVARVQQQHLRPPAQSSSALLGMRPQGTAPDLRAPASYATASAVFALLRASLAVPGFHCLFFRTVKHVLTHWGELCVPGAPTGVGLAVREHMDLMHTGGSNQGAHGDAMRASASRWGVVDAADPRECMLLQVLDWSRLRGGADRTSQPVSLCPCLDPAP